MTVYMAFRSNWRVRADNLDVFARSTMARCLLACSLTISSIHVSCEFDTFRGDTHLCEVRDTCNFANTAVEELNYHKICMNVCGSTCGELNIFLYFSVILRSTSRLPILGCG